MASRPSSPPRTDSPAGAMKGYFSSPFEKFIKEEQYQDWHSAFTLLDTLETYFDSHLDLLSRRLQKQTDKLKIRAEDVLKESLKIRTPGGEIKNVDEEIKKMKMKMTTRITQLSSAWHSAKVVRSREKVTFFFGVMSLLISALLLGMAPEWVHISYTLQALYLLPMRTYRYKRRAWHYFMFDLCYYVTILNFVYIWFFPSSPALFVACYCLSHGSLASAVITWRNSLVFHDSDKVTSLFVHIYAPLTFTTIRHFYPNAEVRFPALTHLPHLEAWRALLLSGLIYSIWQILYWKFVLVDRRKKIESGQRTTSFSFLLNDKRGFIGRTLDSVPPRWREASFMGAQLVYGILTELPAVFLLYDSRTWSGIFLFIIFAVSVWNGAGFYIEVFGRKFERELEALRKELADATARSGRTSPISEEGPSSAGGSLANSPELRGRNASPNIPPIELTLSEGPHTVTNGFASPASKGMPNDETKKDQ